jgi:hypothetical protein
MKGKPMRNLPMTIDPVRLTSMSIATLMTDLIVAGKFGEALWRQSALMMGATPFALRPPF